MMPVRSTTRPDPRRGRTANPPPQRRCPEKSDQTFEPAARGRFFSSLLGHGALPPSPNRTATVAFGIWEDLARLRVQLNGRLGRPHSRSWLPLEAVPERKCGLCVLGVHEAFAAEIDQGLGMVDPEVDGHAAGQIVLGAKRPRSLVLAFDAA